jgi:hypothetical protein
MAFWLVIAGGREFFSWGYFRFHFFLFFKIPPKVPPSDLSCC